MIWQSASIIMLGKYENGFIKFVCTVTLKYSLIWHIIVQKIVNLCSSTTEVYLQLHLCIWIQGILLSNCLYISNTNYKKSFLHLIMYGANDRFSHSRSTKPLMNLNLFERALYPTLSLFDLFVANILCSSHNIQFWRQESFNKDLCQVGAISWPDKHNTMTTLVAHAHGLLDMVNIFGICSNCNPTT